MACSCTCWQHAWLTDPKHTCPRAGPGRAVNRRLRSRHLCLEEEPSLSAYLYVAGQALGRDALWKHLWHDNNAGVFKLADRQQQQSLCLAPTLLQHPPAGHSS